MSSSSDRNVIQTKWADHYAEASQRRRERGWHRRERDPNADRERARMRAWMIAAAVFLAAVVVALVLPK
jgi:hypothetical protein